MVQLQGREYSYHELLNKLSPHAGDEDNLPALLEDFKKRGWLSDTRYTEQIMYAGKGRYGSLRVAHELRQGGVRHELIGKAVAEIARTNWKPPRRFTARSFPSRHNRRRNGRSNRASYNGVPSVLK